jgi:membrane-associated phospholipid phosphatase
MHVALITMNALFAWEWKRRLGLVAFAYVGFVALSSVYLGWHYAIDGYAAIVITVVVYAAIRRWATGKTSAPDAAPVSAAAASTSPRLTTS